MVLAGSGLHAFAGDFGATTETVGRHPNGFETPVNQLVTPAGTLIELPGIRPNALALSPDGQLLVTAGLTQRTGGYRSGNGKNSATRPVARG